jgi:hypothetical protein
MARSGRRRAVVLALAAAAVAGEAIAVRRRSGHWGGRVMVRCRQGHAFETLWIPGVSVTSVRLGPWRVQRCPVGRHWTVITPIRDTAPPAGTVATG